MPSLDSTISFFLIAILLGFTPGPDNLFVLTQSIARGARAGLLVTLGLCIGLALQTAAVALGLAAVFAASEQAFVILKWAGAAYLLYLAWKAWHAPAGALGDSDAQQEPAARIVGRGVIMNLTNPKVLLFFLAFLPQFVDAGRGGVAGQIVWFGAWFIVATVLTFGLIAALAGRIGGRMRKSPHATVWLNRVAAGVFGALAVRLLTSSRS